MRNVYRGDPDAIERIAYELCEVQALNGVIYFEVRYCPQFMSNTAKNEFWENVEPYRGKGECNADLVVQCVNRGLKRGQADFKVKARSILCCITGYPGNFDVFNYILSCTVVFNLFLLQYV